jgi:prepilin-type processing-associated H-X9-DG protein
VYYEDGRDTRYLAQSNYMTNPVRIGYIRSNVWLRRGADRGLVADSRWDQIQVTDNPFSATTMFWPYDAILTTSTPMISFEARHMKPGTPKSQARETPTINMLFCDGHAATISPRQAHVSIYSPGRDTSK